MEQELDLEILFDELTAAGFKLDPPQRIRLRDLELQGLLDRRAGDDALRARVAALVCKSPDDLPRLEAAFARWIKTVSPPPPAQLPRPAVEPMRRWQWAAAAIGVAILVAFGVRLIPPTAEVIKAPGTETPDPLINDAVSPVRSRDVAPTRRESLELQWMHRVALYGAEQTLLPRSVRFDDACANLLVSDDGGVEFAYALAPSTVLTTSADADFNFVEFSPDGRSLATSTEGRVQLWDFDSGRLRFSVQADGASHYIKLLEDGRIAVQDLDNPVDIVFLNRDGDTVATFNAGGGAGPLFDVSPDGSTVAVATDSAVRLIDSTDGAVRQLPIPADFGGRSSTSPKYGLPRFSPDGRWLSVTELEGWGVLVFDLPSATLRWRFHVDGRDLYGAGISPDGNWLLVVDDSSETVELWSLNDGATIRALKDATAPTVSLPFDDRGRIAAADSNGLLGLWDTRSGSLVERFPVKIEDEEQGVAISPDGRWIAAATKDQSVAVFEIGEARAQRPWPLLQRTGSSLASADTRGSRWSAVQTSVERIEDASFAVPTTESIEAVSRDLRYIAYFNDRRTLEVRELATETTTPFGETAATAFAMSPDAGALALSEGRVLEVWDREPGRLRWRAEVPDIGQLSFSPDGKLVASVAGYLVAVRDAATGSIVRERAYDSEVKAFAFSMDGGWLGVLGDGPGIVLLNIADERADTTRMSTLWADDPSIVLSMKARRLAVHEDGNTVTLYSLDADRARPPILLSDSARGPMAFSADGRLLAVTTDNAIGVWDAESGERVASLGEAADVLVFDGETLSAFSKYYTTASLQRWDLSGLRPIRGERGLEPGTLAVGSGAAPSSRVACASTNGGMPGIEDSVKAVIAEQLALKVEDLQNDATFSALGADDLDRIELVMGLEEQFQTEVPDDAAETLTTVQRAIDYIETSVLAPPGAEMLTMRRRGSLVDVVTPGETPQSFDFPDPAARWLRWLLPVAALLIASLLVSIGRAWRRAWAEQADEVVAKVHRMPVAATVVSSVVPELRAVQVLRAHRYRASRRLAPQPTVVRTANAGGFLSVVHAQRREAPEYLALVERREGRDHWTALALEWINVLRRGGAFVHVHYFGGDLRSLRSNAGHGERIEELATRFAHDRLLVFAPARSLIRAFDMSLTEGAEETLSWQSRAVLVPSMPYEWSEPEKLLARRGFVVGTCRPGVISELARSFEQAELLGYREGRLLLAPLPERLNTLPSVLGAFERSWLDARPPSAELEERLISQLRASLPDRDQRVFLAACAVYPELRWQITSRLLREVDETSRLGTLLMAVRLPWFRYGFMPNYLRIALTRLLDKEDLRRVRQSIVDVLSPADPAGTIPIGKKRRWLSRLSKAATPDSPLTDPILQAVLSGRRPRQLAFALPRLRWSAAGVTLPIDFVRDVLPFVLAAVVAVGLWWAIPQTLFVVKEVPGAQYLNVDTYAMVESAGSEAVPLPSLEQEEAPPVDVEQTPPPVTNALPPVDTQQAPPRGADARVQDNVQQTGAAPPNAGPSQQAAPAEVSTPLEQAQPPSDDEALKRSNTGLRPRLPTEETLLLMGQPKLLSGVTYTVLPADSKADTPEDKVELTVRTPEGRTFRGVVGVDEIVPFTYAASRYAVAVRAIRGKEITIIVGPGAQQGD